MAFDDIERWKQMNNFELYSEVGLFDNIECIYVNNCYELAIKFKDGCSDKEFKEFMKNSVFCMLYNFRVPEDYEAVIITGC